jgi:SAM-dependent methyltransferase
MDIGRIYSDPLDAPFPHITLLPDAPRPWAGLPTKVIIETKEGKKSESVIYHPHLAFLKLVKDYSFDSILDIGCGDGNELILFRYFASTVVGVNDDPNAKNISVDFFGDYLDYIPDEPFDAIWCSHVLEHIRNPGLFLDKIFHDLKDGGVLALSVPYHDFNTALDNMIFGHFNRYNIPLLVYALVAAGFDCRDLRFRIYCGQISFLLKKIPNNVSNCARATAYQKDMFRFFPKEIENGYTDLDSLNWD